MVQGCCRCSWRLAFIDWVAGFNPACFEQDGRRITQLVCTWLLHLKQAEDAERHRVGKKPAPIGSQASQHAGATQQPSVTAQMPVAAKHIEGTAEERGQAEVNNGNVQVPKPLSKAEKARLDRELADKRKAKAKEVRAVAKAAEEAGRASRQADAGPEQVDEHTADWVDKHAADQVDEHAADQVDEHAADQVDEHEADQADEHGR